MTKPTIVVRNLRFPLEKTPKYWLNGQRSVSMLVDHLSILFPPGEKFFMDSVRALQDQIQDPTLLAEMRGFHAQEALHGREHQNYNDRLERLGYPVKAIDRSAKRALAFGRFIFGKKGQVGVTAALEHFTALLAQVALGEDSFLKGTDPEMDALWRWHAAEENEHSGVAFDVFKNVGGSYPLRVWSMALVTLFFLEKILQHQLMMMHADGILFDAKEWKQLSNFLFGDPGVVRRVFYLYFEYYRPDFHPHQIDATKLLDEWRKDFASEPVYQDNLYQPRRKVAQSA